MTDQEKQEQIMGALHCCIERTRTKHQCNLDCPYINGYIVPEGSTEKLYTIKGSAITMPLNLATDILSMLKAQEPQYPDHKKGKYGWFSYCPKCKTFLNELAKPKYCDRCGQAVKWV